MDSTLLIAVCTLAGTLAIASVAVLWISLWRFPAISKAEVHRAAHEQALRYAILDREKGEVNGMGIVEIAESTSLQMADDGPPRGREKPDLGQAASLSRPEFIDPISWEAAISESQQTGENPIHIAMRLDGSEMIDRPAGDAAFGPKGV